MSVSFKSCSRPADLVSAEQQLKKLNQLYKFVTEVTNDCLWEWDLQKKEIFWIDGGHKRVLGYPIENAIIPQSFWESCIHPNDKERVLAGLNKIISEGTVYGRMNTGLNRQMEHMLLFMTRAILFTPVMCPAE